MNQLQPLLRGLVTRRCFLLQVAYEEVTRQFTTDAKILRREMEKYFVTQKRFTEEQLAEMKLEADQSQQHKLVLNDEKKRGVGRARGLSLFESSSFQSGLSAKM
jgi:hypothetical protein